MKVVIDANVLIAALIRPAVTREVLLYPFIEYYSPAFTLVELKKHEVEIVHKVKSGKSGYNLALKLILKRLKMMPDDYYTDCLAKANQVIGKIDKDDVPYMALALKIKADGIWSYDSDLRGQGIVRIFSTGELLAIIRKGQT